MIGIWFFPRRRNDWPSWGTKSINLQSSELHWGCPAPFRCLECVGANEELSICFTCSKVQKRHPRAINEDSLSPGEEKNSPSTFPWETRMRPFVCVFPCLFFVGNVLQFVGLTCQGLGVWSVGVRWYSSDFLHSDYVSWHCIGNIEGVLLESDTKTRRQ